MEPLHFKTPEELIGYLKDNDLPNTRFLTHPYYIDAIIGIADDCKLVYSYELLVESLYQEYLEQGDIEDPYEAAMEWVDCNVVNIKPPICHIVYDVPDFAYDEIFDKNGLEDILLQYEKYTLGCDDYNNIILDSEIPDEIREKIESFFVDDEEGRMVIYL